MRSRTLIALAAGLCLTATAFSANAQTRASAVLQPPGGSTITLDGKAVEASGRALYTYDKDVGGTSNCAGECVLAWPPLTPGAGAQDAGGWSVIVRSDGKRQWAYKGRPVYVFYRDKADGAATGANRIPGWNLAK